MTSLPISCPECGAHFSLLHAMEDADGRRYVGLLSEVQPMIVRPLIRYLALFKPAKRGMAWSRTYTLASKLVPMIKAAEVKHNGMPYVVPPQKWADTMLALVENPPKTLILPLKSHGYLISILAGDAESVAAKQEQKHIEQTRNRGKTGVDSGPASMGSMVPSELSQPKQEPTPLTDHYRATGKTPLKGALKKNGNQQEPTDD